MVERGREREEEKEVGGGGGEGERREEKREILCTQTCSSQGGRKTWPTT